MGQDSLDQIKDMLYDHEVAINNNQLWDAINKKRSMANRKLFLSGLAAFIVFASAFVLWQMSAQDANAIESEEKFMVSELDENNLAVESASAKKDQNIISDAHKTFESKSSTQQELGSTIISEKTQKTITKKYNKSSNELRNSRSAVTKNSSVTQEAYAPTSAVPAHDIVVVNDAKTIKSHSAGFLLLNEVEDISGVNMYPLSLNKNQQQLNLKLSNDIECYDYRGKKNNIYAVAYTSADFNMRSLSTTIENEDYMNTRADTESSLLSYHAGLQMKYLFDNGLYFKGGIEYGQVRERFSYRRTTEVTEIKPEQIIGIEIDVNGDTTIIKGNAPVTTITMKNWRLGNTYKTLDFTALAGYQMTNGSWVYSAELGASYNTSFSFSGLILDESGEPFPADNYFNDRINWSILGALNIGYKLNSRTTVFTGMNFKSMLSPINSNINVVDQKYSRFGLHLGVEFKLK